MDLLEYIFEACRFPPADLDFVDTTFLNSIASGRNTTAYKLWNWNRRTNKGSSVDMAYKNVHRRVQSLLKSGLISEIVIPGGFKHGAKNFALTTRGLVYLYSILWGSKDISDLIRSHRESPLLRTFIYPFFEIKTIANATPTLKLLLENFITACCQTTATYSRLLGDYIEDFKSVKSKSDLLGIVPINYMYYRLRSDTVSFIVKCALSVGEFEDWEEYEALGPERSWKEDIVISNNSTLISSEDKIKTYRLLANDKKFMKALKKVEEEVVPAFSKLRDI